jgi:hypothetical protein
VFHGKHAEIETNIPAAEISNPEHALRRGGLPASPREIGGSITTQHFARLEQGMMAKFALTSD